MLRSADADERPGMSGQATCSSGPSRGGRHCKQATAPRVLGCAGIFTRKRVVCGASPDGHEGRHRLGSRSAGITLCTRSSRSGPETRNPLHRPHGERDATGPRKRPLRASEPGGPRITHVVATYQKDSLKPAEPANLNVQICPAYFSGLLAVQASAQGASYFSRTPQLAKLSAMSDWLAFAATISASPPFTSPLRRRATPRPYRAPASPGAILSAAS